LLKLAAGIPTEDELTGQLSSTNPFKSLCCLSPHTSDCGVVLEIVNPETSDEKGKGV